MISAGSVGRGEGVVRGRRRLVSAVITATLIVVVGGLAPATAAAQDQLAAPVFVFPAAGETLSLDGPLSFQVQPVPGASEYLWGFFQDGTAVWENYANERVLSGTSYQIEPGSPAHQAIRAGPLQIWVRGLVDGRWTEAAILDVVVASTAAPAQPCPNITFFGLRGSGEPAYPGENNMRTLAADTFAQFVQRANWAGVKVTPDGVTEYPAVDVLHPIREDLIDEGIMLKGEFASVELGAASLERRIMDDQQQDPARCFIFVGYSQGAWVIGEYLASPAGRKLIDSDRIAGIVLYADPLFDPDYPESEGADELNGIARQLNLTKVGDAPYVPKKLQGKVRSYCLPHDIVCNFPYESLPHAAAVLLKDVPPSIRSVPSALRNLPQLSCFLAQPANVFCPHYGYRHSVS